MNRLFSAALLGTLAVPFTLIAQPAPTGGAGGPAQPVVNMEDQFRKPHRLNEFRGEVVLLVYGDRAAAGANKALGEQFHVHFHPDAQGQPADKARQTPVRPLPNLPPGVRSPEVRAVPIACVGHVPDLVRGMIRSQVRSKSPDLPVWLDFENRMKQSDFPFAPGVPNLVILDAGGVVRCTHSGPVDPEQFKRLTALIETLRKEAVGAK